MSAPMVLTKVLSLSHDLLHENTQVITQEGVVCQVTPFLFLATCIGEAAQIVTHHQGSQNAWGILISKKIHPSPRSSHPVCSRT